MRDETYQLIGLVGFVLAGFVFVAVGIRADDALTVIGSALWIAACAVWMIPLVRQRDR